MRDWLPGLPPVGTVCDVRHVATGYVWPGVRVELHPEGKGLVVVRGKCGGWAQPVTDFEWRPIEVPTHV